MKSRNTARQREIQALMSLLDDPDEEVFASVEQRLLHYGLPVIPNLEQHWENTISEQVQARIEMIIHRIHFVDLKKAFRQWREGDAELLHGALLVAKYQYPDIQSIVALQELERIRRNIWLELNQHVTPVEQVKIVESILYNYYKLKGGDIDYAQTDDFMIHKVIERKKGNVLLNGILYLVLCEMLDMPVRAIRIPRQFVLGYFNTSLPFTALHNEHSLAPSIQFFIDPNSGTAFSHQDLRQYFTRTEQEPRDEFFAPMNTVEVIQLLLMQLAECFDKPDNLYKRAELQELHAEIGQ